MKVDILLNKENKTNKKKPLFVLKENPKKTWESRLNFIYERWSSHIFFIRHPCFISNIWFASTFCRFSQLNDQTVLFLTIQFHVSQQS